VVAADVKRTHRLERPVIPKPISPTELRQNLDSVLREVARGQNQYLVTSMDDDEVMMLSRAQYNAIVAERDLLRELREGEGDVAAGRTYTPTEVRALLTKRRRAMRKR
jgi:PHD/YefM family antitoxin component YafN of YafNO toxin-antitoxin module